jgi:hypothetical protein
MKITYGNQTIDLFNFPIKQVILSLSGGLDSASLFYLICTHFPKIEIIPMCGRDVHNPKDALAVGKIVDWMRVEFPNVSIKDIHFYNFDDRDELFYPKCREAIKRRPEFAKFGEGPDKNSGACKVSKILQIDEIAYNIQSKYPKALRTDGQSANPPIEVMKQHKMFYRKAERIRDPDSRKVQMAYKLYHPYINVDKKFVADIYKTYNLMNTLFPLTRSCVGREEETDNYTKECHKCFWCYEKRWAFDLTWYTEIIANPSFSKICSVDINGNMLDITDKCPVELCKNFKKILGELTIDKSLVDEPCEDIYHNIVEKTYLTPTYIENISFKEQPKEKLLIAFNKLFFELIENENTTRNTR